jgi:hypothetical protein
MRPSAAIKSTDGLVSRCSAVLAYLASSGVDTEKIVGAPGGMFGRADWCLNHQRLFRGN